MWKENDIYSKRDDDSAIGDSEHNSAEEESMNSRRKSSVFDDIDEMTIEPHTHLERKLGSKIPTCLLKSSDDVMEICRKHQKTIGDVKAKLKREIKVLPNADAVVKKTKPEKKKPFADNSALETKLQFLLTEMKKLRELDQNILRSFVQLNESVEEVRWRLAEDEEDFRRKLEEEADEEFLTNISLDNQLNDVTTASNNNYENIDNVTQSAWKQSASESFAHCASSGKNESVMHGVDEAMEVSSSMTYSSRSKDPCIHSNSALTNPTYSTIDIRSSSRHVTEQDSHHVTSNVAKKVSQKISKNEKRKLSNGHAATSDVWIVREECKSSTPEIGTRKHSHHPPPSETHSPKVSLGVPRIRSESSRPIPKSRSQMSSFRMVTDEHSRIGRFNSWINPDSGDDGTRSSHLQSSSNQQLVAGLTRTRTRVSVSHNNVNQSTITKASDSTSSLNSSSSRTSSESSSSVTITAQNPVKRRNSSSKWGRFFLRRTSKAEGAPESRDMIINNNYKTVLKQPDLIEDPALRNRIVVPVSYKRTSPIPSTRWTHHKDDITYL